jgi:hypothetical protein
VRRSEKIGIGVGAFVLGGLLLARSCSTEPSTAEKTASAKSGEARGAGAPGISSVKRADVRGRKRSSDKDKRGVVSASWGGGATDLGRDRPDEGSASGPMSFAVDDSGRMWVLDQVNNRIQRYVDGKVEKTLPLDRPNAQDMAIADDGSVAVLDRFGGEDVMLYGPDGSIIGSIPFAGEGLEGPGFVTGVFTDGDDVYIEREHGPLVKIGNTKGEAAQPQEEIPGRPSRDGKFYMKAGITEAPAGRTYVAVNDRPSMEHRFTREIRFDAGVWAIVLLDSDMSGTIYFAAELEDGGEHIVVLTCLDPMTGVVQGSATMPANTTPEETFRDFVVLDEGGVVAAHRTEDGITYETYDCE